jgi:protein O-mannosyl-transferase
VKQGQANLAVCLLLAAVTAFGFWRVGQHQFINYDDNCYVTENRYVQAGLTGESLEWAFCRLQGEQTYWHPLTWVSHMIDCELFGLKPAGHHLVSLFLHIFNTLLVFLVFQRMTKAFWHCAVLAALFALHPLQVDTVAWVAERKNLLSASFWLLTIWTYVRYTERPGLTRYALVMLSYALGLMCKPVLVTLPFVLLLLDYWPLQRFQVAAPKATSQALARLGWEKAPLFLLAGALCLITIAAHRSLGLLASASQWPLRLRAANALVSYVRYIGKALLPKDLAVLYPYPEAWPGWTVVLCALLLIGVSVCAVRTLRSRPYLFVGWFWFLGVLVPFIGLIQAGEQAMADRFMYVPIIGLFMGVIWGLDALLDTWPHKRLWLGGFATLGLTSCLLVTQRQVQHWRNSETLFRHALAVTSRNFIACNQLGLYCASQQQMEAAQRWYYEALAIRPGYPFSYNNLGCVLTELGKYDEAVAHFETALRLDPTLVNAHNSLGAALLKQGKLDEALPHFQEALRLQPGYAQAHFNLANALAAKGQAAQAVEHYRRALQSNPSWADAYNNLAFLQAQAGNLNEAVSAFRTALRLQPDLWQAHYGLSDSLAKQGKQAEAAEQSLQLAAAHAAAGRLQEAARAASRASDLGKVKEAEDFLREGLRNTPDSYELLSELGRLYCDRYHDAARARNLWELGLQKWSQQEAAGKKPDALQFGQLAINLARLEEKEGNLARALDLLTLAQKGAPQPEALQQQIVELNQKLKAAPAAGAPAPR